ncbi:MAG: trehalase family glycosidase, partial [Woeseiaceae bacterium]|nr:trehalase family glycosidase [Woeseiaceae bacterium]
VDLNALLYRLEYRLAHCGAAHDTARAAIYEARANARLQQLRSLFFDEERGFFADVDLATLGPTPVPSLAASFPLFLELATPEQAERVAARIHGEFLAPGGWLTTLVHSGQQWDRPNGWAPLQWITYTGMCNYGCDDEAREGASRWVRDNIEVYSRTGRLLEKYDVERVDSLATGGEYTVQDGFGWTNGVLLRLMNRLNIS